MGEVGGAPREGALRLEGQGGLSRFRYNLGIIRQFERKLSTGVDNLWMTRKGAFAGQALRALDHSHVDDAGGGRCGQWQFIWLDAFQHHEGVEGHVAGALERTVAL